jgi:tetratricopeptide (TPR) repeat protein
VINLGLAYLGKGDYDKALDELNDVRASNPRNPTVRVAIGRVLAAQQKTSQAVAEFRKALEFYPDFPMAHYQLGLSLMKSDLVAARHAFKEVVRLAPDADISRSAQEYLELLK